MSHPTPCDKCTTEFHCFEEGCARAKNILAKQFLDQMALAPKRPFILVKDAENDS